MNIDDIIVISDCKGQDVILKGSSIGNKRYTDYYCGRTSQKCMYYRVNGYGNCCLGYMVEDILKQELNLK